MFRNTKTNYFSISSSLRAISKCCTCGDISSLSSMAVAEVWIFKAELFDLSEMYLLLIILFISECSVGNANNFFKIIHINL